MPVTEKRQRIAAPFSAEELRRIDDWGFARRLRDRSTVIRELVQRGFEAGEPSSAAMAGTTVPRGWNSVGAADSMESATPELPAKATTGHTA